jgi:tRNA pseudouridine38-40 synthase
MERRRYALRLAYTGHSFRGFQRQPGLETVQGCLEAALAHMGVHARLEPAARTDAGVHALEQVVTFATRAPLDAGSLRAAINGATPADLLCLDAAPVPANFHARASARRRTYVYLVGWPPPPELRGYAWALPDPRAFPGLQAPHLDLERAHDALARVLGEHDFRSFARTGDQTRRAGRAPAPSPGAARRAPRSTVRTITRAEVVAARDAPFAAVILQGSGFLRAMVRNIVGTVVTVAVGAASPDRVSEILGDPSRRYAGVRAPGWGLTLAAVDYPSAPFRRGLVELR